MAAIKGTVETKLGGRLTMWGIQRDGVVQEEHWLDEPAHNMVVDSGLDFLCVARDTTMFAGVSYETHGCLRFCKRGAGDSPTTAIMTDLQSAVGNATVEVISTPQRCGTSYDKANGKITMRITHLHEAEASRQVIKELGWFGSNDYGNTLKMFSRIALPTPVTVEQGSQLITTYELEITVAPVNPVAFNDLNVSGWNVSGNARLECLFPNDATFGNQQNGLLSGVTTSGSYLGIGGEYRALLVNTTEDYWGGTAALLPDIDDFLPFGQIRSYWDAGDKYIFGGSNKYGHNLVYTSPAYVAGSFEITQRWEMGLDWPMGAGGAPISINFINIRGMAWKLDAPVTKAANQKLTLEYTVKWVRQP